MQRACFYGCSSFSASQGEILLSLWGSCSRVSDEDVDVVLKCFNRLDDLMDLYTFFHISCRDYLQSFMNVWWSFFLFNSCTKSLFSWVTDLFISMVTFLLWLQNYSYFLSCVAPEIVFFFFIWINVTRAVNYIFITKCLLITFNLHPDKILSPYSYYSQNEKMIIQ